MAMVVSLWWVCLGQYAPYNLENLVWLKNLSNRHSAPHQVKNILNCAYQLRTLETGNERRLSL